MGLDDILLLSYPCGESQPAGAPGEECGRPRLLPAGGRRPRSPRGCHIPAAKAPHFFRLGDVEVNAGQNASFQCMAAGRAAEAEHFLLQVRTVGLGQWDYFWALALSAPSGASTPRTERCAGISQAHGPSKAERPPTFLTPHLPGQSRVQQPRGPR